MHMLYHKYTNDEVNTTFVNIENKLPGGPENFWLLSLADLRKVLS